MNKNDQQRFRELLFIIASEYETAKFSDQKIKLWWDIFKVYTIEQFENAVYRHMRCPDAGMYFPKSANLTRFIEGTSKQCEQAVRDKAELTWGCIVGGISRGFFTANMSDIDDPVAMSAVRQLGGFDLLLSATHQELTWIKKEFINIYSSIERTSSEELPEALPWADEIVEYKEKSFAGRLDNFQEMVRLRNDSNN